MPTRSIRQFIPLVVIGTGLTLLSLSACSSSSPTKSSGSGTATAGGASATSSASAATGSTSGGTTDPCTLVTAAELSQAVGVQYTAISGSGGECTVKGPGAASFDYTVQKESATNTCFEDQQVATIQGDDGQALSEPGIGDRAVWGGSSLPRPTATSWG